LQSEEQGGIVTNFFGSRHLEVTRECSESRKRERGEKVRNENEERQKMRRARGMSIFANFPDSRLVH
jgi:hypothetical protein